MLQISPIKLQLVERIDHIFFSSKSVQLTFDKLNDPFQHSMSVNFVLSVAATLDRVNGKNKNAKT